MQTSKMGQAKPEKVTSYTRWLKPERCDTVGESILEVYTVGMKTAERSA